MLADLRKGRYLSTDVNDRWLGLSLHEKTFAGRARSAAGDHYAFRVTLGQPGPGSGGRVTPASNASTAPIMSKAVMNSAMTLA